MHVSCYKSTRKHVLKKVQMYIAPKMIFLSARSCTFRLPAVEVFSYENTIIAQYFTLQKKRKNILKDDHSPIIIV